MPAPSRKPKLSWNDFITMYKDVITTCDFFTTDLFTATGLITFYVLFFIQIGRRKYISLGSLHILMKVR
jgi:putative transposase